MSETPTSPLLAVIIPAYKGRHLARTLESFATQTDRRFRVYIGDDASPEDLPAIVAPFRTRLDLVYRRFADNLGQTSLVQHWHRTIALGEEPWLWVFSDDDVAAPDCVESFLQHLPEQREAARLFRFQITIIDDDDRVRSTIAAYPPYESWADYMRQLLRPRNWMVLQNIIFPRSVYRAVGGFYDFPLGFCSDLISWAKFAGSGGLETLARGRVFFRQHTGSISSDLYFGDTDKQPMLDSLRLMLVAVRQLCAERGQPDLIPPFAQLTYYCRQFRFLARPLTAAELARARKDLRELWPAWPIVRDLWFEWNRLIPHLRTLRTAAFPPRQ